MLSIFSLAKKDVIRLVFFDEFDSSMKGEKLGWLRFFLAPMQDGIFYYDGKPIAIGKAVLVFAGGTSESYDEFINQDSSKFIPMKGPDFVSRLRAFIDIRGINRFEEYRVLRRALLLHYLIGSRNKKLVKDDGAVNVEENLIRQMLEGAHYKHESRSMEALLDMCAVSGASQLGLHHLPAPDQMAMHVSRGPLDGMTIGVAAGQDESTAFFPEFSKQLFVRGGNLAHGGDFFRGGPLRKMVEELKNAPKELVVRNPAEKRVKNYLAFPSCLNLDFLKERSADADVERIVDFIEMPHLPASEVDHWDFNVTARGGLKRRLDEYFCATKNEKTKKPPFEPLRHLAWAIGLFRMRLRLIQETQALVVIGGKTTDGWGRFPGVAEEVMLAIAYKRPLYILGAAAMKGIPDTGKASLAIGRYLGLDVDQQSDPMFEYPQSPTPAYFARHDWYFRVPNCPKLPDDLSKLREYFLAHGIGSPNWIPNGLSIAENRNLFHEENIGNCVDIIINGLTKLKSSR